MTCRQAFGLLYRRLRDLAGYGLSTSSLPLIVVDTVGLLCAGLTIVVALSLRGALIRPATWHSRNTTSISPLPHWLADVGEIFPVRHLANALLVAYNPHTTGLGFADRAT